MEPKFTLPYSEYASAVAMADYFKRKEGYSFFIPMSRQEKGVDFLLAKRSGERTYSVAFQVKASRTYMGEPPKRITTKRFAHYSWFQSFKVAEEADFFVFYILYPVSKSNVKTTKWNSVILVFSKDEMKRFFKESLGITKAGHKDLKFGFGFDDPKNVFLTRGARDEIGNFLEFSDHLLAKRIKQIADAIDL